MSTEEIFMEAPTTARYVALDVPMIIIYKVSRYFNVSVKETQGSRRKGHIVKARRYSLYFIWKYTNLYQDDIAKYFRGYGDKKYRDRTIVVWAKKVTNNEIETYPEAKQEFLTLSALIESAIHS